VSPVTISTVHSSWGFLYAEPLESILERMAEWSMPEVVDQGRSLSNFGAIFVECVS
jgi:hypothetical protein